MRSQPVIYGRRAGFHHTAFFLFAALIVIGIAIVPAAAGTGEMQQAFPENDTAGFVPVGVIVIDPTLKAATPDYDFLMLDNEGKANYLRDLGTDFDPVPDHALGDIITFTGTTNLARGPSGTENKFCGIRSLSQRHRPSGFG
jgi:hypothetical protein